MVIHLWALSSVGQSGRLIIFWSQVQVLQGPCSRVALGARGGQGERGAGFRVQETAVGESRGQRSGKQPGSREANSHLTQWAQAGGERIVDAPAGRMGSERNGTASALSERSYSSAAGRRRPTVSACPLFDADFFRDDRRTNGSGNGYIHLFVIMVTLVRTFIIFPSLQCHRQSERSRQGPQTVVRTHCHGLNS